MRTHIKDTTVLPSKDMVGLKTGVTGTRFENKQRGKVNKVYLCDYQESLNPNNEYYMGTGGPQVGVHFNQNFVRFIIILPLITTVNVVVGTFSYIANLTPPFQYKYIPRWKV